MKKMLLRLPVLIIGIPLAYYLIVLSGDLARALFIILISILGQYELNSIFSCEDNSKSNKILFFECIGAVLLVLASNYGGINALFFSFISLITLAMMFTVFRGLKGNGTNKFCKTVFSLYYLPFCLSCYHILAKIKGGNSVFLILASIWALDIGAYIFGSIIRGRKLAPNISPNKTISGALGGALCCLGFLYSMKNYGFLDLSTSDIRFLLMSISIASIGQIADLFESMLKREANVKDSSSLLGAHGGILDRIDSVVFLGPICLFILTFTLCK